MDYNNNNKKRKKVDLLAFQRTLNQQFMEIFEANKNRSQSVSLGSEQEESADLGLEVVSSGLQFFVPLKHLKVISTDGKYEDSVLTKNWLQGFNQLQGDIYSIVNFANVITLLLERKLPANKARLTNNDYIVYLKSKDVKLALILSNMKLGYTAELTSIFKFERNEKGVLWSMAPGVEFDTFVSKDRMSEKEWDLMNNLNAIVTLGSRLDDVEEKLSTQKDVNLLYFVEDVYLDADGSRPVFLLNTKSLIDYLSNLSPY